jgi:glycosyltransferase involved in cell wall biosynthesis
MVSFTVIIPTRNRPRLLQQALASLHDDSIPVVVVDDGSDPEYRDGITACCEASNIVLLRNLEPRGAGYSRNLGVQYSESEWLLFLDDDDQFMEHYLCELLAVIRSNPAVEAWVADFIGLNSRVVRPVRLANLQSRNLVGGCSGLCIRRLTFNAIGGFDQAFPSMQDWDLWISLVKSHSLYYSGISGVRYSKCSEHKITHDLTAKYVGLRRLFLKHRQVWTPVARRQHLIRLWALRQLCDPGRMRLMACVQRVFQWPTALWYFFRWHKYVAENEE